MSLQAEVCVKCGLRKRFSEMLFLKRKWFCSKECYTRYFFGDPQP